MDIENVVEDSLIIRKSISNALACMDVREHCRASAIFTDCATRVVFSQQFNVANQLPIKSS